MSINKTKPNMQKGNNSQPVWEPICYSNLQRYVPFGTLYARFKVRGKIIKQCLDTNDLEVGRRKLVKLISAERESNEGTLDGKLTIGQAIEQFRELGYKVKVAGISRGQKAVHKFDFGFIV